MANLSISPANFSPLVSSGSQYLGAIGDFNTSRKYLVDSMSQAGKQITDSLVTVAAQREAQSAAPWLQASIEDGLKKIQDDDIAGGIAHIAGIANTVSGNPFLSRIADDALKVSGNLANSQMAVQKQIAAQNAIADRQIAAQDAISERQTKALTAQAERDQFKIDAKRYSDEVENYNYIIGQNQIRVKSGMEPLPMPPKPVPPSRQQDFSPDVSSTEDATGIIAQEPTRRSGPAPASAIVQGDNLPTEQSDQPADGGGLLPVAKGPSQPSRVDNSPPATPVSEGLSIDPKTFIPTQDKGWELDGGSQSPDQNEITRKDVEQNPSLLRMAVYGSKDAPWGLKQQILNQVPDTNIAKINPSKRISSLLGTDILVIAPNGTQSPREVNTSETTDEKGRPKITISTTSSNGKTMDATSLFEDHKEYAQTISAGADLAARLKGNPDAEKAILAMGGISNANFKLVPEKKDTGEDQTYSMQVKGPSGKYVPVPVRDERGYLMPQGLTVDSDTQKAIERARDLIEKANNGSKTPNGGKIVSSPFKTEQAPYSTIPDFLPLGMNSDDVAKKLGVTVDRPFIQTYWNVFDKVMTDPSSNKETKSLPVNEKGWIDIRKVEADQRMKDSLMEFVNKKFIDSVKQDNGSDKNKSTFGFPSPVAFERTGRGEILK